MTEDPGPCCCAYGDFYDREGIMVPIHDCPAPAPLEDELGGELTDLERDLLGSLHRAFGVQRGTIRYVRANRHLGRIDPERAQTRAGP